jgi:hypothetical protein
VSMVSRSLWALWGQACNVAIHPIVSNNSPIVDARLLSLFARYCKRLAAEREIWTRHKIIPISQAWPKIPGHNWYFKTWPHIHDCLSLYVKPQANAHEKSSPRLLIFARWPSGLGHKTLPITDHKIQSWLHQMTPCAFNGTVLFMPFR